MTQDFIGEIQLNSLIIPYSFWWCSYVQLMEPPLGPHTPPPSYGSFSNSSDSHCTRPGNEQLSLGKFICFPSMMGIIRMYLTERCAPIYPEYPEIKLYWCRLSVWQKTKQNPIVQIHTEWKGGWQADERAEESWNLLCPGPGMLFFGPFLLVNNANSDFFVVERKWKEGRKCGPLHSQLLNSRIS